VAAPATARVCREHESVAAAITRLISVVVNRREEVGMERFVGLDVHRDFCEVALVEQGQVRSAGRVATMPEALTLLAQSLGPHAHVALEATANAVAIARLLRPHMARVVLTEPSAVHDLGAAKTETIDARSLARLLVSGCRVSAARQRLAGDRPEGGCGRDTGARISKAVKGQSRAAGRLAPEPARALSVTKSEKALR